MTRGPRVEVDKELPCTATSLEPKSGTAFHSRTVPSTRFKLKIGSSRTSERLSVANA